MSPSELELPNYLLANIRRGEAVLFLGAGASVGSTNRRGETPPLSDSLAKLLSTEACIPFDETADNLSLVAQEAQRKLGDQRYYELLSSVYQNCAPSNGLVQLAQYPWHRIYTTNVDDALERAFERSAEYSQHPFVHSAPICERPEDRRVVQIIKLNGSITHPESGLIFTPEEYHSYQHNIGTWYEEVARDFLKYTFIFVGTNLNEPIFNFHVERLKRAMNQRQGRSYLVLPDISELRREALEAQNIYFIKGTVEQLANSLHTALGSYISALTSQRERSPALYQLLSSENAEKAASHADQAQSIHIVDARLLDEREPEAPPGRRRYYYGAEPTWRDILDGVPATLLVQERLEDSLEAGNRVCLLDGPAGSGKTSALMACALNLSKRHPAWLVLWVDTSQGFPTDALQPVLDSGESQTIVFIDDFAHSSKSISEFLERTRDGLVTFVLSGRSNQIRRVIGPDDIHVDTRITARSITETDADRILEKVEQFGPWHWLKRFTPEERRRELLAKAEQQLLVGLRRATEGLEYDKIVESEYRQLSEGYPKSAYRVVATASMHGIALPVSTFDLAIKHLSGNSFELPAMRHFGLEGVIQECDGRLRIRHRMLAEYTMKHVAKRPQSFEAVKALMFALSRYEAPLRKSTRGSDLRLFTALVNHNFLWKNFRRIKDEVLKAFGDWESKFGADALFWLQYALFESLCGPNHIELAINHVRTALRIFPTSYQVINGYANIHFAAAENAENAEEALSIMESATETLEQECSDPLTEPYAIVGIARGRVKVLRRWYPGALSEEVSAQQRRLRELQRRVPDNKVVADLLQQLPLLAAGA